MRSVAMWETQKGRVEIRKVGYLLFVGRTRRMTQYADTAVSGIDPDFCGASVLGEAKPFI